MLPFSLSQFPYMENGDYNGTCLVGSVTVVRVSLGKAYNTSLIRGSTHHFPENFQNPGKECPIISSVLYVRTQIQGSYRTRMAE